MRISVIVLLVFFVGLFKVSATHIVGGELYYSYLGADEYEITLIVYRDCGPTNVNGTDFDAAAPVGIYSGNTLIETLQLNLFDATVDFVPVVLNNECLSVPPDVCVEEAIYTGFVNLPPSSIGYDLVYQRCCRNPSIINIVLPEDAGATFWAQIPGTDLTDEENSNPVFNNFPPVALCINFEFSFDHSATDNDADSLTYEFCTPLHGASFFDPAPNPPLSPPYTNVQWETGYSNAYPIDSDPGFMIDLQTGMISGTPTQLGQYVLGVCVNEFRNGILLSHTNRDFQFNVAICEPTTVALIPNEEPCQGLEINFGNNSINAENFYWDFGDNNLVTDTSSAIEPNYTYSDTGTYVVTMIANPGTICVDTTSVTVLAYLPITADFNLENDYCDNGSRYFDFTGVGNFGNDVDFSWDFGSGAIPQNSSLFNPGAIEYPVAGTYNVTLNIENEYCESSIIQSIIVDPTPIAGIEGQLELCGGLTVDFISLSQFESTYTWDFGELGNSDQSSDPNPSYSYNDYGTYTVTLTVDEGSECEDSAEITVNVLPEDPINMQFNIGAPQPCDPNLYVSVNWTGSGADIITWDMGDGSELEGNTFQYLYDEFGLYTITITAEHELCDFVESEEVDVFYDLSVIDLPVIAPNVLTPNNDNKNDTFRIFFEGESIVNPYPSNRGFFDYISDYSMKIFDRWGVLIFDSMEGTEKTWDGTFDGNPVNEGTYYYMINYKRKCLDTKVSSLSGHIEVLRD